MSQSSIIAAIAALRDFSVDQVVAYSGETAVAVSREIDRLEPAVVEISAGAEDDTSEMGGHVGGRRWRVVDPIWVRARLSELAANSASEMHTPHWVDEPSHVSDLLLAEELIIETSQESDLAIRALLAASASNHLRQFLAPLMKEEQPWWLMALESFRSDLAERVALEATDINDARLLTDSALIALTQAEASGAVPPLDLVYGAVHDVCRLPEDMDGDLQRGLFHRLVDLATAALSAGTQETSREGAPDRLLKAVASLRAKARAVESVRFAAQTFSALLEGIRGQSDAMDTSGIRHLFTLLGNLPDGRARILVYTDLLPLLPRQYSWYTEHSPLPDALVEAVADPDTSSHLQVCADVLESELMRSPYQSPSALIGQVAHVFPDLAARGAPLDETVFPRAEETRRELLGLVGAPL